MRSKLAAYKAPKHVFVIDTIGRAPNGKVDYKRLKAYAANARAPEPRRRAPDRVAVAWRHGVRNVTARRPPGTVRP